MTPLGWKFLIEDFVAKQVKVGFEDDQMRRSELS